MTSFNLPQTVTIWKPTTSDGFGGHSWAAPVTVPARWADVENDVTNAQGDIIRTSHAVYTEALIEVDDYVLLGASVAASPPQGALRIVRAKGNPSYLSLRVALI